MTTHRAGSGQKVLHMSDQTPLSSPRDYRSSAELSGFELYEQGVAFLVNLGIDREDVLRIPELAVTTIASLVKQGDRNHRRVEALREQYDIVLRERNHLREIVGALDHTPQHNQAIPPQQ